MYIVLNFLGGGGGGEIENVYLFPLYLKWEKGPTSYSTLLETFIVKPTVENDTVEYVSMLYHHHNQMTQKEKERSSDNGKLAQKKVLTAKIILTLSKK